MDIAVNDLLHITNDRDIEIVVYCDAKQNNLPLFGNMMRPRLVFSTVLTNFHPLFPLSIYQKLILLIRIYNATIIVSSFCTFHSYFD